MVYVKNNTRRLIMSKVRTRDVSGFTDSICGSKTIEATITRNDGKSATSRASSVDKGTAHNKAVHQASEKLRRK